MYNPYDLLDMLIDGDSFTGRPIEFDSEVSDSEKMTNSLGGFVKPTKISTICPKCGQGLVIDVILPDPPFPVVEASCVYCHPEAPPVKDPFMNPIDSKRIEEHSIDPMVHNPNIGLLDGDDESSVADRFDFEAFSDLEKALDIDASSDIDNEEGSEGEDVGKPLVEGSTTDELSESIEESVDESPVVEELVAEPVEELVAEPVEELVAELVVVESVQESAIIQPVEEAVVESVEPVEELVVEESAAVGEEPTAVEEKKSKPKKSKPKKPITVDDSDLAEE